ncbi:ISC system 2Fe-2S type ferredoxin [Pseudomonas sp. TYF_15]|jgi:2Fe-2S ferredoxin|uniref:2Fe-2S ferredoxin n=2 Tax=Pseudomonas putida group TaxID=136845 RepID=A0A2N1IP91_9PSED|nr:MULTISPECIES: ISC system 2Fe-2S type ferredoxin [Pseudomonas]WHH52698.1 ISC system 2Fe-2S type ferredoxin [Pseudomonas sp. Ap32]EKT4455950.1 ISC system 2Fe-2S type ferredoxin [Pseudomonas putida]EKT4469233.1 ISC system 2Fe-2S type ferredoxin [Pseudomonas putida]EKT4493400.1 ISC system 2Fe-2S type ferredoxin [Pseudomonas putida]EKT4512395.1 ISC system 2Fe-2S type ferredoxin [Pseudomonas putida]
MPLVTFLPHEKFCPEGLTVEVEPGTNILELAHDHHIEMESACGGVKACTTCHCIVRKGFDSLEEADELEEDMLDKAWGLEAQSRLGCQVVVADEDLTIEIPKYSLNHAAEAPH